MALFDKLIHRGEKGIWEDVEISLPMARAIRDWLNVFYNCPDWNSNQVRLSGLPAIMTGYLATLAVNELTVSAGTGARAEYLDTQLAPLLRDLQTPVQLAAVAGEVVIRPFVEHGSIFFDIVQAGRYFPTRYAANGDVAAGFFCDYKTVKNVDYVRLEIFDVTDRGLLIQNKAYRCKNDVLLSEVPLDTVPDWADLEPEGMVENVHKPLFGVIRMPFANTIDDSSPLPVSMYANAMDSIMEFDKVYTEMIYELHSGKRKRIIERQAMQVTKVKDKLPGGIPLGIGYQDITTDNYIVLDPMEQHKPFDDYTPSIRVAEYISGMKAILHMVENQCHLSPGSLSIDERSGAVTATQVISEDKTTFNTCSAIQTQGITQGLLDLIEACNHLCDIHQLAPIGDIDPAITFGDSIFEDTQQEFARRFQMAQADILKPEKLLSWYFGVDEDTAAGEFLAAQTETVDLFGGM